MNEENKNKETTEVLVPADELPETESSKGGSSLSKLVIVGAVGVVTGAAAFGLKKLKERNKKKTIEKLRKEGWTVEEPADKAEEEVVEGEVVSEEEVPEEDE